MRDHDRDGDRDLRLVDDLPELSEAERLSLERALDALGAAEAASARAGLTDRVVVASLNDLRAPVAGRVGPVPTQGRSTWVLGRRVAAALAMAAALGIAALAGRSGPAARGTAVASAPTGIERDIEAWLTLSEPATGDLAVQTSTLDRETAALRETLSRSSAASDLWAEEGAL